MWESSQYWVIILRFEANLIFCNKSGSVQDIMTCFNFTYIDFLWSLGWSREEFSSVSSGSPHCHQNELRSPPILSVSSWDGFYWRKHRNCSLCFPWNKINNKLNCRRFIKNWSIPFNLILEVLENRLKIKSSVIYIKMNTWIPSPWSCVSWNVAWLAAPDLAPPGTSHRMHSHEDSSRSPPLNYISQTFD